ncbi:MAG: dihydrolipoamide acetyltransferase family protein [Chitinophagales bacterium]
MAEIIQMPLMSDTMTEGVIVEWHKVIGDTVEVGDLLAEIETDKATMEFEAPEEGVLLWKAEIGQPIPVNALLAIIAEEGEDVDVTALVAGASGGEDTGADEPVSNTVVTETITVNAPVQVEQTTASTTTTGRIKASPLAKRLAKENNIALASVTGSGDEGRIIKRDIIALIEQAPQATPPVQKVVQQPIVATKPAVAAVPVATTGAYEDVRVSQMRKTIARRLAESKYNAPHFYLTSEIDMGNAFTTRKRMNEFSPSKISFNDLVVKAAAMALRQHKAVNASWLGDYIRYNEDIHIGVAVAVEEGLVVPVINHADNKSLSEISATTRALAGRAREKKIQPSEMQGNTFTISNLGMFGIDEFTAIINPPAVCILAVGRIADVPAVIDGEIKPAKRMKVTLSCDHRVVDGATGAKFLQTLKNLLEDPIRILV